MSVHSTISMTSVRKYLITQITALLSYMSSCPLHDKQCLYTHQPGHLQLGTLQPEGSSQNLNKKAQLTLGLRATAPSFKDGRQPPSRILSNRKFSAIRSANPENPNLEPNMEWIECIVCEIFAFKLYCDVETGVQGHSRSSKAALFDRARTTLYSSSIVTMPLSITVSEI